jgi:hypothetical protein
MCGSFGRSHKFPIVEEKEKKMLLEDDGLDVSIKEEKE